MEPVDSIDAGWPDNGIYKEHLYELILALIGLF